MRWFKLSIIPALILFGSAGAAIRSEFGTDKSGLTLLSSAKTDFAHLWNRSSHRGTELIVCLYMKGDSISSASEYPGQWIAQKGMEVTPMGIPCKDAQGTAHTHLFGNGEFSYQDSVFATNFHGGTGVNCILYSSRNILCDTPQGRIKMSYK